MGLATRSNPHDPAEPSTHAPHDDINSRIGEAFLVMSVSDPGAVAVECPEGQTRLCPLGEEGGQRLGWSGQGSDSSPLAPALPLAPGAGVRLSSGWGEFRLDRCRYPHGVASGQRGSCGRVIVSSKAGEWVRHQPLSPPGAGAGSCEGRLRPRSQASANEGLWKGAQIPGTFQARETLISRA